MEHTRDAEGLQVAPSRDKQILYNSEPPQVYHQSDYAAFGHAQKPKSSRICGLRRTTFWLLVVIALLVIAAATAGGVAGGLLSSRNNSNSAPEEANATTSPLSSSIPTSSPSPSSTELSSTEPSSTEPLSTVPSTTSSAPVTSGTTGIAENPCPSVNGTIIQSSKGTSFTVLCGVDWPLGFPAADGSGKVRDISRATVYTLEECIEACVNYDGPCKGITYDANLSSSIGNGHGGNCWFKDRIGKYWPGRDTTMSAGITGL